MRTDNEIAASVGNMLKWHVAVDDEKINIKVVNGIVTLEGFVHWDFQRQAVEDSIRCLPDVVRLDNFIGLRPPANQYQ